MKNTIKNLGLIALVAVFTLSFTTINKDKKVIKTDVSKVVWKGYKVTGSHEGTIAIQSGSLIFEDDKLTSGEFVIDMTTINTTDLEGEAKGKLEGPDGTLRFFLSLCIRTVDVCPYRDKFLRVSTFFPLLFFDTIQP